MSQIERNPFETGVSYDEKEIKLKSSNFKKLRSCLLASVGVTFDAGHLHKGSLHFPSQVFEPQKWQ